MTAEQVDAIIIVSENTFKVLITKDSIVANKSVKELLGPYANLVTVWCEGHYVCVESDSESERDTVIKHLVGNFQLKL